MPSFSYVALYENIIDSKKYPLYIYSAVEFVVLGLSVFFSSFLNAYYPMDIITKSVKYGIFKGGDCLYLTIITISVLFIVAIGCQTVTVKSRKIKWQNIVFIGITGAYYPMDILTKSVKYGIFKGGDCLYLTIITISVLFIVAIGCQTVTVKSRKIKWQNIVFIGITGAISALVLL